MLDGRLPCLFPFAPAFLHIMALGLGTVIYTFLFLGVLLGLPGLTVYRHYGTLALYFDAF